MTAGLRAGKNYVVSVLSADHQESGKVQKEIQNPVAATKNDGI